MPLLGSHLLGIKSLNRQQINHYLDTAEEFVSVNTRSVKKVPPLRGKTVINLFLEPSTRTRVSFEIAAKRLSADAVNLSGKNSSTTKGESLLDTVRTIQSMNPDILVIRHNASGAAEFVANNLERTSVINAGDGMHEHPTQALLDALTLRQAFGSLDNLKIVFVGDAYRSRVTRSDLLLFSQFGCELRIVSPSTLAKEEFEALGAKVFYELEPALEGADVVVSLRMKHEYLNENFIPSLEEYARLYCITKSRMQRYCPNAVVLAPGPFIRGIEIDSEVIESACSLYEKQVNNGVAVRMAAIFLLGVGRREIVEGKLASVTNADVAKGVEV